MNQNVNIKQLTNNIFKIVRYKNNLQDRNSLFVNDIFQNAESTKYKAKINRDNLVEFYQNDDCILKESLSDFTISFKIKPTDNIYGLGIHQYTKFNRRNSNITMLQNNGKSTAIPFLTSTGNYAILIGSASYMSVGIDRKCCSFFNEDFDNGQIDKNKINIYASDAEQFTYYVILGDINAQIKGYRLLTGKANMLPKWAYGYFQSKEHYKTQEEILLIAHEFRKRHIPIDCIVQDWNYWGNLGWNALRWDKNNYPNVKKMCEEIHSLNMKLMVSVWPSFGKETEVAKELLAINGCINKKDGHVEKWGYIHDPYNPKASDVFWKNMKENIFDYGSDGWWLDSTEPGADVDKCSHLLDSYDCYLGSNERYLNTYALMTAKNVYTHQRNDEKNKRVYILTRSGYAGQQKYSTSTWTGDIHASWDCLKRQINSLLSFSMSGIPYSTTDIGGFFVDEEQFPNGCNNLEYRELYTRWFWFGLFSPIFRSHGTSTPREPWNFGSPGEKYYDSILKALKLRYALMPYFYSLAHEVYFDDKLFIKPLISAYPLDEKLKDIYEEYLIGDSLLFGNVTSYHVYSKEIYLPKDSSWFDIWTNKFYEGGNKATLAATIEKPILLVKGGSILLLTEPSENVEEQTNKILDVRIYSSKDAKCTYYDDNGNNYDYEKNDFLKIIFSYDDKNKSLSISKPLGNINYRIPEIFNIYLDGKYIKSIKYDKKNISIDLIK